MGQIQKFQQDRNIEFSKKGQEKHYYGTLVVCEQSKTFFSHE